MTLAATFSRRESRRNDNDRQFTNRRNPEAMPKRAERRSAASARAGIARAEQLRAIDEFFADEFWLDESDG